MIAQMMWPSRTLSEIAIIYNGNSINKSVKEARYTGLSSGLNYIGTKDIDFDGKVTYENGVKIPVGEANFKTAPKGSVFVCSEGGSAGKKTALIAEEVCFGNKLFAIVDKANNFDSNFMYYFTRSLLFTMQFKALLSGIIGGVTYKNFGKITIPLPPLPEQRRIVARIEALFSDLDHGTATLRETKRLLELYRQSVLKEAFEDFDDWRTLESVCVRVFDGPFGSNLKAVDYVGEGIRVVRLENIKKGWFDDTKRSYVTTEKYESIKSHTVYPSDLIMSTFTSDCLKVCQLPQYIKFAANKADCVGIRLKEEHDPRFFLFYLSSRKAYNSLVHHVHGATRPRLNTKQIKSVLIPICNIDKQREVIAAIESRLSICSQIEQTVDAALQKSDALRQSILKQAFEGRL